MKRLLSILFLPFLVCFSLTGCKQSADNSSNVNDSDGSNIEDNQSLYNRIILDYYDQRVARENTYENNVYNDFPNSARYYGSYNNHRPQVENLIIDAILKKTEKGAYFVAIDLFNNMDTYHNKYDSVSRVNLYYADGKPINYPYNCSPYDVWFEGNIYYPLDAVFLNIITIEDLSSISLDEARIVNAVYDSSVPALSADNYNTAKTEIRICQDFFTKIVKNHPVLSHYCKDASTIHIVETFASFDNVVFPEFGIDNYGIVPYYSLCDSWDNDLNIGGTIVSPLNSYLPLIWANGEFINIDSAFNKGLISKDAALGILNRMPNHNSSSNSDTYPYVENQSFFNRVISDYYEQIILSSGRVNKSYRKGLFNYDYPNGQSIESPDGTLIREMEIPQVHIAQNYGKSAKGAYLFAYSDVRYSAQDGYQDLKIIKLIIDGEVFTFFHNYLPFVWYKGTLMFLAEAYSLGLINKEEIHEMSDTQDYNPTAIYFDCFAKTLNIKDELPTIEGTHLYEIKNDYLNHLKNKGYETIDGNDIDCNSVHVLENYGTINGKELLSIQVDNVQIISVWENDLSINGVLLNRYQPIIYFNNSFYTIKEAYENDVLSDEEIEEMSILLDGYAKK